MARERESSAVKNDPDDSSDWRPVLSEATVMRALFLSLAIVGAVVPYYFFIQHFQASGYGLGTFVSALFVNGAAGGFSADLLITSVVFWIFMFMRRPQGGPTPWLFIALNLMIGVSCALPAYLYASSAATD